MDAIREGLAGIMTKHNLTRISDTYGAGFIGWKPDGFNMKNCTFVGAGVSGFDMEYPPLYIDLMGKDIRDMLTYYGIQAMYSKPGGRFKVYFDDGSRLKVVDLVIELKGDEEE